MALYTIANHADQDDRIADGDARSKAFATARHTTSRIASIQAHAASGFPLQFSSRLRIGG